MSDANAATIPQRKDVPKEHTWDLSKLFADDAAWEKGLEEFRQMLPKIEGFKGTLGESPASLLACLTFMNDLGVLDERLGYYAHLRMSEDAGDSSNQDRFARYMRYASEAEALASYQAPEIQSIPDDRMASFLASPELAEFRIYLKKLLRYKPHILSEREERLLAMQSEANQTAQKSFQALTDVDMSFGTIDTPEGNRPLTHGTYASFLLNPDRDVRRQAYLQLHGGYDDHKNTLSSLYAGSVQLDIYRAKVRNFPSARAASLFRDDVPEAVYDSLIQAVHDSFPAFHAYYALRTKVLDLDQMHIYDGYAPLVKDVKAEHTYEEAVDVVTDALKPLGREYCDTLHSGLLGGWVDRYENKGKRSGAFSAGSYAGDPHILMNYQKDVLRHVFTLAHEGGHSMHSWYSSRNNPFQHYQYTIFEAEVASTFNEQLLGQYLLDRAETKEMRAYLIGKEIDDIVATIYRQTMFAEFEHLTHQMAEQGTPLTVDSLRSTYRNLLSQYFGPTVALDDVSDIEGLRIPHFYRAFYVYKYATGLSAAIVLAQAVMDGGDEERDRYLAFLRSGGSRFPLESLRLAGVDMTTPDPVRGALNRFAGRVKELEQLLES
jgi:oligoendopeptidase F